MIDHRQATRRPPTPREGTATSADGTAIAFERQGEGPPVVLVASALADRSDTRKLAALLAQRFTVLNYDRRGRGGSGDTQPYAVDREIEDLASIVHAAGGSAYVFGSSSGALLALRAASKGVNITRLALYEPPLRLPETSIANGDTAPADSAARVRQLLAAGRRNDVVKHFMTEDVGVPAPFLLLMRLAARGMWSTMAGMAHTLPYDYAVIEEPQGVRPLAELDWVDVTVPTLAMSGGKSPARLRRPAELIAAAINGAQHRTLAGQNHGAVMMAPKVVAAALVEFFEQ